MSWYEQIVGGLELEKHQIEGRDFLLGPGVNGHKYYAARPRLGKTYTSVGALNIKLQLGGDVLVVCPPGVRSNWKGKLAELASGDYNTYVMGYTDVVSGKFPKGVPDKFETLILDEAHKLSNRDAQRTLAVFGDVTDGRSGLVNRAYETWCLSGTPLVFPNKMWTTLRTLAPQCIINPDTTRPYSYSDFEYRYCSVLRGVHGRRITGARNVGELKKNIHRFYKFVDYDVLGPGRQPPTPETLYVDPPREYMRELKELEQTPEGRAIMRAVESGDYARLARLELSAPRLRIAWALAKVPAIVAIMREEWEDDPTAKYILFAWHRDVIAALRKALEPFTKVACIVGGMDDEKQDREKERFWKDPKCGAFIGQHAAAGEGIDLSIADEMIMVEEPWDPIPYEQSLMRVFNIKKPGGSRIRLVALRNSTDARVHAVMKQKFKSMGAFF